METFQFFRRAIVVVGIALICTEAICRVYVSVFFQTDFARPEPIEFFYPELGKLAHFNYNAAMVNLLVLGGSVVFPDTIPLLTRDGSSVNCSFCDLEGLEDKNGLQFNMANLAYPGHTTLDSKIKLSYVKERFDYVFVYHGINDSRSNNISNESFDANYRHIEFYDDLSVVLRHQEISSLTTLFVLDWLAHQLHKACVSPSYIPREFLQFIYTEDGYSDVFDKYLKFGADIKTQEVFENNLNQIKLICKKRKEVLIFSTYAWHQTEDYSWNKFIEKKLDYSVSFFPTEIYGHPPFVADALTKHNEVIRRLAQTDGVLFFDFNRLIAHNGQNFDDICHLTPTGCEYLSGELENVINEFEMLR